MRVDVADGARVLLRLEYTSCTDTAVMADVYRPNGAKLEAVGSVYVRREGCIEYTPSTCIHWCGVDGLMAFNTALLCALDEMVRGQSKRYGWERGDFAQRGWLRDWERVMEVDARQLAWAEVSSE